MHKRTASCTARSIADPAGVGTRAASEERPDLLLPGSEYDRFITLRFNGAVPPQQGTDCLRGGPVQYPFAEAGWS